MKLLTIGSAHVWPLLAQRLKPDRLKIKKSVGNYLTIYDGKLASSQAQSTYPSMLGSGLSFGGIFDAMNKQYKLNEHL